VNFRLEEPALRTKMASVTSDHLTARCLVEMLCDDSGVADEDSGPPTESAWLVRGLLASI